MVLNMGQYEERVFALLKSKKPGDSLRITDDSGKKREAILVRRGRQKVRVKTTDTEESLLISFDNVDLETEKK